MIIIFLAENRTGLLEIMEQNYFNVTVQYHGQIPVFRFEAQDQSFCSFSPFLFQVHIKQGFQVHTFSVFYKANFL